MTKRKPVAPPPRSETRLDQLKADPSNRRQHPERNRALLAASLEELGAARSIVIDETDTVLAGNGVIEAAAAAGITKLQVVEVSGDTVVAVRRTNLTPEQKRRLAMYDNRTAELAEWNPEQLGTDAENGLDLVPFFTDGELSAILQADELTIERKRLRIARPTEVAWVLVALPLSHWPQHQAAVEAMQTDAVFTAMAVRGHDEETK